MNILLQAIIFSTFIWSMIYAKILFLIISLILTIYSLIQIKNRKKFQNQTCFFTSNFNDSGCPLLKVKFEVDMEKIDNFLKDYNLKNPKKRLTKSHIAMKSIAEGLKGIKNGYLTFGNFLNNKETDVCLVVNVDVTNITLLKVFECQKNLIKQIASQMKGKISKIKTHVNKDLKDQEKNFKILFSFMIEITLWLAGFISYDLQKEWHLFKVRKNHFGNNMVTNVSNFLSKDAIASHVPCAYSVILLTLNKDRDKVVFENGVFMKKKFTRVNLTYDCRYIYGDGLLKSVERIQEVWKNFENYI